KPQFLIVHRKEFFMIKFILGILMGLSSLALFIQNIEVVQVNFLIWTISMPRFLLLFTMLAIGLFIGWLISSLKHIKRKKNQ
ncbi:MAG: LapA family protein, partial [Spirochaetaceae bacterium]|nr:LapA family protein [Spirochaetaceae bacterium]